ncbi:P-loop NTPase family protein [Paenibacillus senegalensis]|uniref:hypothetical protein n=1 Tax=Paenibacillus senegalensis TaxID=1465766 RepID=UPI000287F64C|nr:hypothetical protein [Paenibacillus senegalensis]
MKAVVVSEHTGLVEKLNEHPLFQTVQQAELPLPDSEGDVIIIDESKTDINELLTYYKDRRPGQTAEQTIFYLLTREIDSRIHALFASKEIAVIDALPVADTAKIVQEIVRRLQPEAVKRNKNVITFFGADHSVGTTMLATACAELLSRWIQGRIGLFILNEQPGTQFLKTKPGAHVGLDEIRMKLFNHILTKKELNETYLTYKNLSVLQGPRNLLANRHYHPEHAERLLNLASTDFDVLLVDAGANIEYGLAVGALTSSQQNFLITTQQEAVKARYERMEQQVFKPLKLNSQHFFMIVSKYVRESNLPSAKDLANYHKMVLAGTVPYLDLQGWQAEFEQKTLLHYEQLEYTDSIERLCMLIARQVNLEIHRPQRKQTLLTRWFGGAKGGH